MPLPIAKGQNYHTEPLKGLKDKVQRGLKTFPFIKMKTYEIKKIVKILFISNAALDGTKRDRFSSSV
jgi:hypothetical protein